MIPRAICLLLGLGVLGVGLARPSVALVVLGTALVGLGLVRTGDQDPPEALDPINAAERAAHGRAAVLRLTVTLISYVVAFAGLAVALAVAGSVMSLAVIAWLGSIGALVLLGLRLDRLSWTTLTANLRLLFSGRNGPEVSSVLVVTGAALLLRVWDLDMMPVALHVEEAQIGQIALSVVRGGEISYFRTDPALGAVNPFAYGQATLVWLFGSSVSSLRTVSALSGALCVPVIYAIGRLGWGPITGGMAAWLLAVSHLHIHYSRLGLSVMPATLLLAVTVLLLLLAAQQGRLRGGTGVWTLLIGTGVVAGLAQHVADGARVIPIIAAPILVMMVIRRWITAWHLAAALFAFLVVFVPLAANLLGNPIHLLAGLRETATINGGYIRELFGPDASLPTMLPRLLAEQGRRALGLFVAGTDRSTYYPSGPRLFDVVTAALLWLGLAATVSRLQRFHEAALACWFGVGLLFGAVVTREADHANRIMLVTPAAFLIGGVALARAWELLHGVSLRRYEWLAAPVGTAVALWLVAANVVTYFFEYVPRAETGEPAAMARDMRGAPDRYRYYLLTAPHYDQTQAAIRYIASGIEATNLVKPDDFQAPPLDGRGIVLLALPDHHDELKAVEAKLARGEERAVLAPNQRLMYYRYEVPPTP